MFFFPLGVLTRADIMWKREKLSLLCPFQILEMQDSEQIELLFYFFLMGKSGCFIDNGNVHDFMVS